MSTAFTTEPKILWTDFLARTSLQLCEAPRLVYTTPHRLLRSAQHERTLFAYEDDGFVSFERFGMGNPEILYVVMADFGVRIFDEYGIPWPEESGG
jgi:hypothetical protein